MDSSPDQCGMAITYAAYDHEKQGYLETNWIGISVVYRYRDRPLFPVVGFISSLYVMRLPTSNLKTMVLSRLSIHSSRNILLLPLSCV